MSPTNASALTMEDLRASTVIDQSLQSIFPTKKSPETSAYFKDVIIKEKANGAERLRTLKEDLEKSRLPNVLEVEHQVALSTGFTSRMIVVSRTPESSSEKAPIFVMFHGGGWSMGYPESWVAFARTATLATGIVLVLPSYSLAPERKFPAGIDDSWAIVQHIANEAAMASESRVLLPSHADAAAGFIIGGSSAGANLAAVVAHLARDNGLHPRLTGQFLSCGLYMAPPSARSMPAPYAPRWVSYVDNSDAPVISSVNIDALVEVLQPSLTDGRFAPFAWPDFEAGIDVLGRVGKGHVGLPPAYLQAAGMDPLRDDTLVYETVLREESGVRTKLDFYPGFPHVVWAFFKELEIHKKWEADTIEGLKWLLEHERD